MQAFYEERMPSPNVSEDTSTRMNWLRLLRAVVGQLDTALGFEPRTTNSPQFPRLSLTTNDPLVAMPAFYEERMPSFERRRRHLDANELDCASSARP